MAAIAVQSLSKSYQGVQAVDGVSFEIREGELFGLLGPNGAGKTTTISMLATLVRPTAGTAQVNGHELRDQDAVRRSIGIVFQDPSLDGDLTGRENLDFHARLYRLPRAAREARIAEVLRLVRLEDKASMLVKTYSGGMKRRLEIARGLIHRPAVLFLDEPTLGLDPQTRRNIWEYIKALNRKEKVTVILTTHYMEEADALCDRIAIIDQGKIVALDTPAKLKAVLGKDSISVEVADPAKLAKVLAKEKWTLSLAGGRLAIGTSEGAKAIPRLMRLAAKAKIPILSVDLKRPTLEDVFIHYTGHAIRDERADGRELMRQGQRLWRR
ncbi:MAG: ATP-binding cassette domain-containing protein [Candidatus Aenigmarchaeota archaeon]|nr:ATP-binding cassette domain-containing protein [Candidatus Aenigmarchaeota archaeon]